MAPSDSYGGPSYTGRNRTQKDGGPNGIQRSHATSLKEHDPLFTTYEHLSGLPRGDAALTLLRKVASIVKPIMSKRSWRVQVLAEFLPAEQNLLGLNINRGYKICVRLRYHNDAGLFLPFEQVVDTMLHELSHIVWGEHDGRFHGLWDELRDEHEVLVRKGYTGEGFLGEGKKLGGSSFFNGGRAAPHEMRRLARASAEKRKTRSGLSTGSGRRLGGATLTTGQDVREVIAGQTLLRNTINKGCASGRKDAGKLSDQSSTFKTKAEEDDANDRAISQAIFDLMEEEESAKLKGTFEAASTQGGLAWHEDHGLYDPASERPETRRAPTEDEQLKWAIEESMRAAASTSTHGLNHNFPPESLISPISPLASSTASQKHKREAEDEEEYSTPRSLFSPVSPINSLLDRTVSTQPLSRTETHLTTSPIATNPIDISEPFNPDQWTCEICTCINPLRFLACDACGVERPVAVKRERVQPASHNGTLSSRTIATPVARTAASLARVGDGRRRDGGSSLGWRCRACGAFMEHKWWTCSACGGMKEES